MMMAGATAVGVHTAPLLQGLEWFGKMLDRLERWMEQHRYASLQELCGLALPHLQRSVPPVALDFSFDAELCTECGRCVTVCAYRARHLTPEVEMILEKERCRSCGLCVTVCPTDALRFRQD
jgi:dihydroorotate dehydrogenase (fumarate)